MILKVKVRYELIPQIGDADPTTATEGTTELIILPKKGCVLLLLLAVVMLALGCLWLGGIAVIVA
jgi:hypothetical protein